MKVFTLMFGATALAVAFSVGLVTAQQPQQPPGPQPFSVGNRLGLPINPAADGAFNAMSSNVKVYGAIYSAESCSYDPVRNPDRRPQPERRARHADQQRLGVAHQPTTDPFTRRAGSGFRLLAPRGRI